MAGGSHAEADPATRADFRDFSPAGAATLPRRPKLPLKLHCQRAKRLVGLGVADRRLIALN